MILQRCAMFKAPLATQQVLHTSRSTAPWLSLPSWRFSVLGTGGLHVAQLAVQRPPPARNSDGENTLLANDYLTKIIFLREHLSWIVDFLFQVSMKESR